jgi:fermentation-respiration switch protein FrsA (DUF1100 family)
VLARLPAIVRFFVQLAIAVVAAILIWTVILMLFEEQFIYFPSKYPEGMYHEAERLRFLEDCWFTAEDGVKLHAWFAKSDSALATLVMAHGNAGNLSHRLPVIRALRDAGFNVLMFDYRGYGRSDGRPNEVGIYRDGRAAFDYAVRRADVDSTRVIVWGTSLGGAVAVDVALQRPIAGLILESTFPSARDVARVAYPFLPAQFFLRTKLDSFSKIPRLSVPILFMHGSEDSIIPLSLGRKLYEAASQPKEFYLIPGADHNDTFWVGGKEYLERVRRFAQSVVQADTMQQ